MLQTGEHSDLVIRCHGVEWQCHKAIIFPRCSFLKNVLDVFHASDANEIETTMLLLALAADFQLESLVAPTSARAGILTRNLVERVCVTRSAITPPLMTQKHSTS